MYEKFFGLDELPFDGLPDNRFYFVGNCQHQALELLTSNLSRNGSICILSGPSGSGKTTLVRMLIRSLPKRMRIIAIDDPRLDPHMLFCRIDSKTKKTSRTFCSKRYCDHRYLR